MYGLIYNSFEHFPPRLLGCPSARKGAGYLSEYFFPPLEEFFMTNAPSAKPAFHIGIAMAGAVSGGAYSAGVFDFLVEALNEWEKEKAARPNDFNVPKHDVFISTVSGTSAGGITAALGLMSLAGGIRSVTEPAVNPVCPPIKRTLPELYDLWVKRLRLFGTREPAKHGVLTGNQNLLSTSDIKPGKIPNSVLNSDCLTRTAREAVSTIRPYPFNKRLAFFTEPTHLFLTRTNLDGSPRAVVFGDEGYPIPAFEGRAHFAISGLGARKFPNKNSQWMERCSDPGDPVNVGDLGTLAASSMDAELAAPFEALTQATLATSAVPALFAARRIVDSMQESTFLASFLSTYSEVNEVFDGAPATKEQRGPGGPQPLIEEKGSACIDGGTMNNEPFELVRWAIRDLDCPQNSREPDKADRAVILIAPFPPKFASSEEPPKPDRDMSIKTICKMAASAYFYQARYRATDLVAASDPNVYSRYLISPKRTAKMVDSAGKPIPQLATALLHAAGGFLDEQFREHDFVLGRRNCQSFLKNHFVLNPRNHVFGEEADPTAPDGEKKPIIPLFGTAAAIVELAPWPKMPHEKLAELRVALQHRFDQLVGTVTTALLGENWIARTAARIGWWWHRKGLTEKAMGFIQVDLKLNEQLAEPAAVTRNMASNLTGTSRTRWIWILLAVFVLVAIVLFFYEPWLN